MLTKIKLTSFRVLSARCNNIAGIQIDNFLEPNSVNIGHLIINRVGMFNVNYCVCKNNFNQFIFSF
jgi:hypothetical protein